MFERGVKQGRKPGKGRKKEKKKSEIKKKGIQPVCADL